MAADLSSRQQSRASLIQDAQAKLEGATAEYEGMLGGHGRGRSMEGGAGVRKAEGPRCRCARV